MVNNMPGCGAFRTRGGYLISKIHQVSGRIFAKVLKEAEIDDINPAQGRILFALWQKDGVPISELVNETLLHKSTLTKMLDRLERLGHISREASAEDRRISLIVLTEKNHMLRERYSGVSDEMRRIYYRGFGQGEIELLDALLGRVLDNLVEHEAREKRG